MNETKNHTSPDSYREGSVADATQTKVDVVVTPSDTTTNQNKISVTVTTDGKLTKADAGRASEQQQDVWVNVKLTKGDIGKLPDIDVNIHEQWNTKITKVDSIKTA